MSFSLDLSHHQEALDGYTKGEIFVSQNVLNWNFCLEGIWRYFEKLEVEDLRKLSPEAISAN